MSNYWQPSGSWKKRFRDALLVAFTPQDLQMLTMDYFGIQNSFNNLAPPGMGHTQEFRLLELIEQARMNDWLLDLVAAALERRPRNPQIRAIADDLGLTPGGHRLDNSTGKPFEEIIQQNAQFIDADAFNAKLAVLMGQVCWVHIPGGGGTGFLVGPDLVITNDHVIERLELRQARWQDVRCRFDYKVAVDGSTLGHKKLTEVKLHPTEPLVGRWPPSQHDWQPALGDAGEKEIDSALLRLAEPIGDLPVGGDTADPQAEPRGWIDVHEDPPPLAAGNQIFLLQHPKGEPQRLSIGTVKAFNDSGTRLRYDANSMDGSSGSPCFNADLQLVALHHAHDTAYPPKWNQGIPLTLIQKVWKDSNITVP